MSAVNALKLCQRRQEEGIGEEIGKKYIKL